KAAPAITYLIRHASQLAGERVVAAQIKLEHRERVRPVGIEPRRNEDEVRLETAGGGPQHPLIQELEALRADTRPERHVDRRAPARPCPDLLNSAGTGGERVLVRRDKQHTGVLIEGALRAVAVVYVVVHDQHAPARWVALLRDAGGNRRVREQAEAHGAVGGGVVPRRA